MLVWKNFHHTAVHFGVTCLLETGLWSTVDIMMIEGNVRERRQEEEKEDEARSRTTTTRMQSTHKTSRIGVTGV